MVSLTVENYLKAALMLELNSGAKWITTGQLADALQVTPGTVTTMLKVLAGSKLASYKPYAGIRLTKSGRNLALRVLRRHRLIELLLAKTLDLNWDQVHEEAERMEHSVSDALINRVDEYLGYPDVDPHGDPIPSADGQMRIGVVSETFVSLASCVAGDRVKLVRVINQQPSFLRSLTENRLEIGSIIEVERYVADEPIQLRQGNTPLSIEHSNAGELIVERLCNVKAA